MTNLKFTETLSVLQDLKDWLKESNQLITENNEQIIQLRDQLCAGFFLIYCTSYETAQEHLEQVKESLVPEYFEALKEELHKRNQNEGHEQEVIEAHNQNKITQIRSFIANFLLFIKEIALGLLEKMKSKHSLLVHAIKSSSKNFLLFCQRLIQVILVKLRII